MTENPHPSGTATVRVDNDRVRVTEWRFRPGEATGHHRHAYDYIVVPIAGGMLRIVAPDGTESSAELVHGQPYYRDAGVEHDVINDDDKEVAFIEVELKAPGG